MHTWEKIQTYQKVSLRLLLFISHFFSPEVMAVPSFLGIFRDILAQWFLYFSIHQNYLEGLLKTQI